MSETNRQVELNEGAFSFVSGLGAMGLRQDSDSIWEEEPVSPTEFFKDFYREPCYSIQQEFVDAMMGLDPLVWDTTYEEFQCFWGKGSGKNHTSAKALAFIAYKLICLKEPQLFFPGIGRGTAIDLVNVSVSAYLAKTTFFKDFVQVIRNTKIPGTDKNWFIEHGMNLKRAIKQTVIEFPKNINAHSLNSEKYAGEGLNILVVIFDEIGGFRIKDADDLYTALRETQRSRFPSTHKRALLSWKRSQNDYMSIRYEQGKKEKRVWQRKASTWEVNTARTRKDFEEEYVRNPERARMTYECEGELAEASFFRYRYLVRGNVNRDHLYPLANRASIVRSLRNIKFASHFKAVEGVRYVAHIDLGTGLAGHDCLGFCMGHAELMQTTYDAKMLKDLNVNVESPGLVNRGLGVVIDLMLQVQAPADREVQFAHVIDFLLALRDFKHFEIMKVSYDSWQSRGEIQRLIEEGFDAELYKVDLNTEAYDTLKGLLYAGLLDYYYNSVFIRECEELITTPSGKVDHPEMSMKRSVEERRQEGSKDVADAVASVCVQALKGGGPVEATFLTRPEWDGTTLIDPAAQEKELQSGLSRRAKENAERLKRAMSAPLVQRGEVPLYVDD